MIRYLPYNVLVSADPLAPDAAWIQRVTDPDRRRRLEASIDAARKAPGKLPRLEPRTYEQRVVVLLNAIARAKVGIELLKSLERTIPVWIVPYQTDGTGSRDSITGQLTSALSDGVKIRYSPDLWMVGSDKHAKYFPGYGPVETLFHELVHASRFSNLGFSGLNNAPLREMVDHEEFLAVMMTDVLRSEWRAKKFERNYTTSAYADQSEMERYLSSNRDYLKALAYFMADPFVRQIARMPMAFNPFRDLSRLEAAAPAP